MNRDSEEGFKITCLKCGNELIYKSREQFEYFGFDQGNLKPNEMNIGMYKSNDDYKHGIECQCGNAVDEPE